MQINRWLLLPELFHDSDGPASHTPEGNEQIEEWCIAHGNEETIKY